MTGNLGRIPDADIATYTDAMMGEPSEEKRAAAEELLGVVATGNRGTGQEADTQAQPRGTAVTEYHLRAAESYAAACASCHKSGRPQPYGGLDFRLSTAVDAADPQNIVNVTLFGLSPADGQASAVMPAFGGVLSDEDMPALLGYLRAAFTDRPAWEGMEELVSETRPGSHHVVILPTDGIERGPGNLGAEEQPWRQD